MISAVDQSEGAKMNLKLGGHHWKLFPDLFFFKKLNIKFLTEFLPSPFLQKNVFWINFNPFDHGGNF